MKILIEKVPQGIKLTFISDAGKKPESVIFSRDEFESVTNLCRTAFTAEVFRFEYQTN